MNENGSIENNFTKYVNDEEAEVSIDEIKTIINKHIENGEIEAITTGSLRRLFMYGNEQDKEMALSLLKKIIELKPENVASTTKTVVKPYGYKEVPVTNPEELYFYVKEDWKRRSAILEHDRKHNMSEESKEKIDVITDYGKGISYKSYDGKEWATIEQAHDYNEIMLQKLAINPNLKLDEFKHIKTDELPTANNVDLSGIQEDFNTHRHL